MNSNQPEKPTSSNSYSILTKVTTLSKMLTFILFVTLPFIGFWLGYQMSEPEIIIQEKIVEVENIAPEVVETKSQSQIAETVTYSLESVDPNSQWGTRDNLDRSIIEKSSSEERVLVPSLFDAILIDQELRKAFDLDVFRYSFDILVVPEDADLLILYARIPDSDGPASPYFSYNIETGDLRLLETTINFGWRAPQAISPNGRYVAGLLNDSVSVSDGLYWQRDVVVVDLVNDVPIKMAQVGTDETLVESVGFGGLPAGEFNWLDDNTLEYSVYDPTKIEVDEYDMETNALIEKRTVTLNHGRSIESQDDLSDNKTYVDEDYGFNFEYPSNCSVIISTSSSLSVKDIYLDECQSEYLSVSVYQKNSTSSLKEWYENILENNQYNYHGGSLMTSGDSVKEQIQVNGREALLVINKVFEDTVYRETYLVNNDYVIQVLSTLGSIDNEYQQLIESINF